MKKFLQIIVFKIGVECLGFPNFHRHNVHRTVGGSGKFYKAYSKK
jgi:hypothetical protein